MATSRSDTPNGGQPSPRSRTLTALQAARWPVLAAVTVAAWVLGYLGFQAYFDDTELTKSGSDLAYLSLQLFVLESGSVPQSEVPWQLEIARIAAPLATGTALVAALAAAFREQIQDWRLRREHDHIVVSGLGERGNRLATELLAAGYGVVAVDADSQNPALDGLRRLGAAVVVGDARDLETLERARLHRASHIVCLAGNDSINAEIALRATELVAGRTGPALSCLVHVHDPDLCLLLRSEELASAREAGARLDFFNLDEHGARVMLAEHAPFLGEASDDEAPRVLVVGSNRFAQHLIAELARRWRNLQAAGGSRIELTVVDPDATDVVTMLRRRYPLLDHAADLVPTDAPLDPLGADVLGGCRAHHVYVCVDDTSGAVHAALRVEHALPDQGAVIVVALAGATGMARVFNRPRQMGRIRAFDVLERTLRPDLLLGGTYELLARAIHDEYAANRRRQGDTPDTNPSMVPWESLPATLKESNRDQAADIGTKLAAIGWDIAPLTDWDADKVTVFSERQIEMLAEMEHERWVNQRLADGWTLGRKDVEAKTSPHLVDWADLDDGVRELDRDAIRGIPAFLARAGYQIVTSSDLVVDGPQREAKRRR